MPSMPSPSQSPATGTTAGHVPAPKVKEVVARRPAVADLPGAGAEHGHVVAPVAVEVTGQREPRASPKVKVAAGAMAGVALTA